MMRLTNEKIVALRRACDGNLVDLFRIVDSIKPADYADDLHQALLFAIRNNHTHAIGQLLESDYIKANAHKHQNEALRVAIDSRSIKSAKALLSLENVREHAQYLSEPIRDALKTLLQSEYQDDFTHYLSQTEISSEQTRMEALAPQSNALQFSKFTSARNSEYEYFSPNDHEESYSIRRQLY